VKDQVVDVKVIDSPLAKVASDHYPVMMVFKSDAPANGAK
jgi:endonuclease/exonuclease/phosphatase family metal-dependent hydrolase